MNRPSINNTDWLYSIELDAGPFVKALQEPESYQYEHLESSSRQIRLVKIVRAKNAGDIHCKIEIVLLDQAPAFIAVSYVWGKTNKDQCILLQDRRQYVTSNLKRFLLQVTQIPKYKDCYFWIDAHCIDQEDQSERSHQVGMMSDIYRNASSVLTWLGPSYDHSDLGMQLINKPMGKGRDIWSSDRGHALIGLCWRAYWTRLWVVQELHLAKKITILCGDQETSWQALENLTTQICMSGPSLHQTSLHNLDSFKASPAVDMLKNTRGGRKTKHTSLYQTMFTFANLECANPKDRVYALLGIVEPRPVDVPPDYSLDVVTILHRVLRNHHNATPPKSLWEVVQQCCDLANLLNLPKFIMLTFAGNERGVPIPSPYLLDKFPLHQGLPSLSQPHDYFLMRWWAATHMHPVVEKLWAEAYPLNTIRAMFQKAKSEKNFTLMELLRDVTTVDPKWPSTWSAISWQPIWSDWQDSPLHAALRRGHFDEAKWLLLNGNVKQETLDSCLRMSCRSGNMDAVNLLLNVGHADPNAPMRLRQTGSGSTALHEAIMNDQTTVVTTLVRNPALNVNVKTLIADVNHFFDPEVHRYASEHHAYTALFEKHKFNLDALHTAPTQTPVFRALDREANEILHTLLSRDDLDINRKDNNGLTPLLTALATDNYFAVEALLNRNDVDANCQDKNGLSALQTALQKRNFSAAEALLLRNDVVVNCFDDGEPPLFMAIEWNDRSILSLLCANESLQFEVTYSSQTALTAAISAQSFEMFELLLRQGLSLDAGGNYGCTALEEAISTDSLPVVQRLLQHPGISTFLNRPANARPGLTPLIRAINRQNVSIVDALVNDPRVSMDIGTPFDTKETQSALQMDMSSAATDMLRILLQRKDFNCDLVPAIRMAIEYGQRDILLLVLNSHHVDYRRFMYGIACIDLNHQQMECYRMLKSRAREAGVLLPMTPEERSLDQQLRPETSKCWSCRCSLLFALCCGVSDCDCWSRRHSCASSRSFATDMRNHI